MSYERSYFHDATRHSGSYPADEALQIEGGYSPQLKRLMVKLAARLPYAEAEEVLAELAEVQVSDSTIWGQVQEVGKRAEAYLVEQAQQHAALPDPDEISRGIVSSTTNMGVSMDGAMFNVRGEGWKEAKIGCAFTFAPSAIQRSAKGDAPHEVVQADQISYVFHFGSPEPFGQRIWAEANRRGWMGARQKAVLGDGAPWIWNLATLHFSDSTHIVDWYHSKQHLWAAANLIHGVNSSAAAAFVEQHEDHLYCGQVDHITYAIEHANHTTSSDLNPYQRAANYFIVNQSRMQYAQFQQSHLPIGSGTVESGCKQFKARFTQSGMRWSHGGAVHLMPLRAAVMSKRFDDLWNAVCH